MSNNNEYDMEERKEYLKEREEYAKNKYQQSDQFDKNMLLLSSGSFGVTFSFINNIIKGSFINKQLLFLGWIMFSLSILSTLISFLFSQIANSKAIDEIDKAYEDTSHEFEESYFSYAVDSLNWYSIGFFIIAVFSILIFTSYNI